MEELKVRPEQKEEIISKLADKLEIKSTEDVVTFGIESQKKISDFSDKTLKSIKAKDLEDTGSLVADLLKELNTIDINKSNKGILGFFKKKMYDLKELKSQYESVSSNIDAIVRELEKHQIELTKDCKTMDELYNINENYFNEISLYIAVGEKKIKNLRENELKTLAEIAEKTNDPADVQRLKDMDNLVTRLEKKVYDLELTRTVSLQMAPQIRMIQNANSTMVDKLISTVNNTIPLWKSQMLIAIGTMHSKDAADTQRRTADVTNKLLRQNSENMKEAVIEIHEESERGIIDIETLRETNKNLIDSVAAVQEIQKAGRKNRENAKKEIETLQKELITKLKELTQEEVSDTVNRGKGVLQGEDLKEIKGSLNFDLEKELEDIK